MLPPSVTSRFDVKCRTVAEAVVCVEVSRKAAGEVGAILAALYCYITPVQVAGVSVETLIDLYTGVSELDVCDVPLDGTEASSFVSSVGSSKLRSLVGTDGESVFTGTQSMKSEGSGSSFRSEYTYSDDMVVRNRLGKKAKRRERHNRKKFSGNTRFSPSSVISAVAADEFGAHGDVKASVTRWEARAHIESMERSKMGKRCDKEQVTVLNKIYTYALSRLVDKYKDATKAEETKLSMSLLNIEAVEACVDLGELGGRDTRSATLLWSLRAVESVATKSMILLELMRTEIISDLDVAPLKSHVGAKTKVNVKLSNVLKSAKDYFNHSWDSLALACVSFYGMANDQFSAWVMWYLICKEVDEGIALRISHCAKDITMLKDLSTSVKALGLNSTHRGALICELNTLQGRGAVPGDADADVLPRISEKEFYSSKAATIDPTLLRKCVREVLAEELATQPKWMDKEDYWTRRWMYTKSGSHTRHIEDVLFGDRLDLPDQPTRREFSEAVKENVVALGSAEVFAGLSWKLENGKTRAIYGCDSRSYYTFDYLLRPIEAVWRNKTALLNPGEDLQSSMYPRLSKQGPYYYMLDFDDYNSQHTLEAMKIVIEEATKGAPEDVRKWAVDSWDNMYVRWISSLDGKLKKRRMVGTLPSGHRATTFVNTILNAAYCRAVIGEDYQSLGGLHAGDDVILWGASAPLSNAISKVEKSSLRVNRSKQSIGQVSGEFLRVAFNKKEAFGYLGRAISGCVSGNWVTEAQIAPRSYLENFCRMGWTMANRSKVRNAGSLLTHDLHERVDVSMSEAHNLCTNRVSLGGTPIMDSEPNNWVKYSLTGGNPQFGRVESGGKSFATDDYLSHHVDVKLLRAAGINMGSLKALMLKASYKPRGDPMIKNMLVTKQNCPPTVALGIVTTVHFKRRVTTESTALQLLERLMSGVDWRYFAAKIRGTDASVQSVTGKSEWPVGSPLGVPYSDNMQLRDRFSQPMLMRPLFRVFT